MIVPFQGFLDSYRVFCTGLHPVLSLIAIGALLRSYYYTYLPRFITLRLFYSHNIYVVEKISTDLQNFSPYSI